MVGAKNMKGKKEMEIRKPKFNVGDKVIDNYDDIYTVAKINGYSFNMG